MSRAVRTDNRVPRTARQRDRIELHHGDADTDAVARGIRRRDRMYSVIRFYGIFPIFK